MTEKREYRLGKLQLRIMQVLWNQGSATVAEMHSMLADNELAYTTIATMLRKMEARGLVSHRSEGRRFVYQPAVSEDQVTKDMTGDLVERLFAGRLADMVSHLLDNRDVSPDELDELQRLIADRKNRT